MAYKFDNGGAGSSSSSSSTPTTSAAYKPPKYKASDYTSQAASIVDAQIAQGKAINKNARAAAIRDYANMLADLAAARDSNQQSLGQYATAARARQAASMASRGMDVGEGSITAEAATSMLHEGKLAEILAQYQRGEMQAARDRDNHFDEARNNDLALERARAGKVNEIKASLESQAFQRWAQEQAIALQVAKMNDDRTARDAQLTWAQTQQDKADAAAAQQRMQSAMALMTQLSDKGYTLPEVAAYMRGMGFTDAETTAAYGGLSPNTAAYNRIQELQGRPVAGWWSTNISNPYHASLRRQYGGTYAGF